MTSLALSLPRCAGTLQLNGAPHGFDLAVELRSVWWRETQLDLTIGEEFAEVTRDEGRAVVTVDNTWLDGHRGLHLSRYVRNEKRERRTGGILRHGVGGDHTTID